MESSRLLRSFLLPLVVGMCLLRDANGCPTIVSRSQWNARSPKATTAMRSPVEYVIIHHTVTPKCTTLSACSSNLRGIQNDHMDRRHFDDIGYTFLVSSDGSVYEGRGWDKQGAHAPRYNSRSIGIAFIGNFQTEDATQQQQDAAKSLIACAVSRGKLQSNYKLLGHRQTKATDCPGNRLYNAITGWPNWQRNP